MHLLVLNLFYRFVFCRRALNIFGTEKNKIVQNVFKNHKFFTYSCLGLDSLYVRRTSAARQIVSFLKKTMSGFYTDENGREVVRW